MMGLVAAILIGGGVATAVAGMKISPYLVTTGSYYAFGSMADARASAPTDPEYIGCTVAGGPYGTSASCYALDSNNVYKMCSMPSGAAPTMLPAIESIGSQSYIYFSFDTSGNCTTVEAINTSYVSPMVP
jgi:hypothetical protein